MIVHAFESLRKVNYSYMCRCNKCSVIARVIGWVEDWYRSTDNGGKINAIDWQYVDRKDKCNEDEHFTLQDHAVLAPFVSV
jgi:hypothetical protein